MARRLSRERLFEINKVGQASGLSAGTGIKDSISSTTVIRDGHLITTEITLDLGSTVDPISSNGTAGLAFGTSGSSEGTLVANPATLGQITEAVNGVITESECVCLEVPTGTGVRKDIDIVASTTAAAGFSGSLSTVTTLSAPGGDWVKGQNTVLDLDANATDDKYIYLVNGAATAGGASRVYTGGKFVIRLYGYAVPNDVA